MVPASRTLCGPHLGHRHERGTDTQVPSTKQHVPCLHCPIGRRPTRQPIGRTSGRSSRVGPLPAPVHHPVPSVRCSQECLQFGQACPRCALWDLGHSLQTLEAGHPSLHIASPRCQWGSAKCTAEAAATLDSGDRLVRPERPPRPERPAIPSAMGRRPISSRRPIRS